MLTTPDIVKLCVPFLFALLLIWIREWYLTKRERNQKQDALWRILLEDPQALLRVDDMYQAAAESYAQDETSPRVFITHTVPSTFVNRLAELDKEHAYIYDACEVQVEGARKIDESLDKLREQFHAEPDKSHRDRLAKAIEAQIDVAREQNILLAESEAKILELIQKARNQDKQPLTAFKSLIEELRRRRNT